MYDTIRDAKQYLRESIIRYKREPYIVMSVNDGGRGRIILTLEHLSKGNILDVEIKDEHLDFSPVPLGYGCTEDGSFAFHYRVPSRSWKQGLHPNNTKVSNFVIKNPLKGGAALKREMLYAAIKGKVLPFKEAVRRGGVFHKHFCVDIREHDKFLWYKGVKIGSFNRMNDVVLDEKYAYLDTYVNEVIAA